jgi:hypothetical protein
LKIKIAYLSFPENQFRLNDVHKIRGYLGNLFREHDLFHNHKSDGTLIYRYPLIQCKVIYGKFYIVAIEKAIEIFSDIFFRTNEIEINDKKIILQSKELKIKESEFGITKEMKNYMFISPWLALNQENFVKYKNTLNQNERLEILRKCLIGNILSMCNKTNGLNYEVIQEIKVDFKDIISVSTILKGNKLIGFKGYFNINFEIPELLGIGKECSRGFGCLKKV